MNKTLSHFKIFKIFFLRSRGKNQEMITLNDAKLHEDYLQIISNIVGRMVQCEVFKHE